MVNNLNKIKPLLTFNSEDTYYFLQILQRSKENPIPAKNSVNVKNYYIKSVEHLESKMDEIVKLCDFFNARAYLRLTPRSYKVTALHHLRQMAQMIADGNYKSIAKSYLSSSGSTTSGTEKRWIVDIDSISAKNDPDGYYVQTIKDYINNDCRPYGDKILLTLPTRNGLHLITKPFDCSVFNKAYPDIETHKDNPCNLYIP